MSKAVPPFPGVLQALLNNCWDQREVSSGAATKQWNPGSSSVRWGGVGGKDWANPDTAGSSSPVLLPSPCCPPKVSSSKWDPII